MLFCWGIGVLSRLVWPGSTGLDRSTKHLPGKSISLAERSLLVGGTLFEDPPQFLRKEPPPLRVGVGDSRYDPIEKNTRGGKMRHGPRRSPAKVPPPRPPAPRVSVSPASSHGARGVPSPPLARPSFRGSLRCPGLRQGWNMPEPRLGVWCGGGWGGWGVCAKWVHLG